ncbi:MAG: DNA repair protein RadA [Prochlorococcus sp. SP3034]|nr:DNA repair protein RadA [Prochlorococcus sp. SP3034]|tara:strand:+ start:713 stop:2074 length:1362 start_codon:yes stop_codon:yes gene_type:complete
MSKKYSSYVCQNCGSETSQYFGRCSICNEWNTIIEEKKNSIKTKKQINRKTEKSKTFSEIEIQELSRVKSGFNELDRVLGGGFVNGSVVLLGGEPGIGKSTLVLQAAANISLFKEVLYITAEESLEQVKIRWERLDQKNSDLKIFAENELSIIIDEIKNNNPSIAIIDSIQAIHNADMDSTCGSVSQVRSCSSELQQVAKESNITLLIIGHVTKDGNLAGPKTLEHLVDVVLNFEGDHISTHRLLRSFKNRFGATLELGIFEMYQNGLKEVKNPSSNFTNKENIAGVATAITNEGTRSFAVDIQALVNKSFYNNPRRTTTGISLNRLHQILAVIEKHIKLKLSEYDCYLASAGGFEINDPSSDLGIAIAILSSLLNKAPLSNSSFIGELGLSGQLRQAKDIKSKLEESIRLGFKNILIPKTKDNICVQFSKEINIIQVLNINEAFNISLEINL